MTEKVEPPSLAEGDEKIAHIREVRNRISEQFEHDPYQPVAYYMELQNERPEKLPGPRYADC